MRHTSTLLAAALLFLASGLARAQEARYTVTFPGNLKWRQTVNVDALPEGGKRVRLSSQPLAGSVADVRLDGSLRQNAAGQAEHLRLTAKLGPLEIQDVEGTRLESGSYRLQTPKQEGVLRYAGPVYTPMDLLALVGRRVDPKATGPQKGVYLDPFATPPVLRNMTLEPGEKSTLTLGEATVPVRAVKLTVRTGDKPGETRTGTLFVGPFSETLKAEPGALGLPFTAKAPSVRLDGGGFVTEFEGLPVKNSVRRERGGGLLVETTIGSGLVLSSLRATAAGEPVRWENQFRGRKFVITFSGNRTGGEARYRVEAGEISIQEPATGRPFFPPYLFATELWEQGRGPLANLAVGEKREGDNYILVTGQRESLPFTLERREDVSAATAGGTAVTLRHYRFDTNTVADLYTDGSRLVCALGSDGSRLVREGWEAFADSRKAPDVPKK